MSDMCRVVVVTMASAVLATAGTVLPHSPPAVRLVAVDGHDAAEPCAPVESGHRVRLLHPQESCGTSPGGADGIVDGPGAGTSDDAKGSDDNTADQQPRSGDTDDSSTSNGTGSAASALNWGTPSPQGSDEFNYGSTSEPAAPDPAKWNQPGGGDGGCWAGHAGNGKRCAENTRVIGGMLRQTGEANGDSGWVASKLNTQYGRWEARVRSKGTGSGNKYHPLLLIWPTSEQWPQGGEYDFLENTGPGEKCIESFMHYPHGPGATQQEFSRHCGVDLSQWNNVGFEWTPDHLKGFVNGKEWFSYANGASGSRQCIQCMTKGFQTIQLDNFYGSGMQPAEYDVDWVRFYPLSDKSGSGDSGSSDSGNSKDGQ